VFNVSGLVAGQGIFYDEMSPALAGTVSGSSTLSGSTTMVWNLSGYIQGDSIVALSVPEPIFGVANISAYMEVVHVWPPVCGSSPITGTFKWGQGFGPEDLAICLTDLDGNPTDPICISYTLYQAQLGCALKQIGPEDRKPSHPSVGCYYATGDAGDCGQPGVWAICWKYQRTFGDPVVVKCCYFLVLDSVLCPVPGDTLLRECKYGWD
jgi:hypothetical protein